MKKLLLILLFGFSTLFAFEDITADNFDQKVKNKNVIVDFYYTWWPACDALGKSLTKYNTSKTKDVTIYKVNLENQKALAKRFKIEAWPVLMYLKDGEVRLKRMGISSAKEIEEDVKVAF